MTLAEVERKLDDVLDKIVALQEKMKQHDEIFERIKRGTK